MKRVAWFLFLFFAPHVAEAQRLVRFAPPLEREQEQRQPPEPSLARPILFGALLGTVGWAAGTATALATFDPPCSDFGCGFKEFLLGGAIGGTTGLSLGVHLGNRRRGNFLLDFLASAATWGAGIGVAAAVYDDTDFTSAFVVLLALPIIQTGVTVAVERATGR